MGYTYNHIRYHQIDTLCKIGVFSTKKILFFKKNIETRQIFQFLKPAGERKK